MPAQRRKRKASPAARQPATKRSKTKHNKPAAASTPAASPPPDKKNHLESLPDELVLLILQQVQGCHHIRRRTYYNVSLTSRRLNRTANDLLYEAYSSYICPPTKFLRTLIANPDLAARVKSLSWHYQMGTGEGMYHLPRRESLPVPPSSGDKRLLRESLKRLAISGRDRGAWENLYASGELGNLLKLALLHTPNLRELSVIDATPSNREVVGWQEYTSPHMQLLLNAANGRPTSPSLTYENLSNLYIRVGAMQLAKIYPIFDLPALRTLSLAGVHADNTDIGPFIYDPRKSFSTVTSLEVVDSFIASEALAELVESCKALKSFRVEYDSQSFDYEVAKIDYTRIATALQQHKDTLESIDIDDDSERDLPQLIHYDRGHLASFHDFPKLHVLGVPFEALPGADARGANYYEDLSNDSDDDTALKLRELLPPRLHVLKLTVFESEEDTDMCADSLELLARKFRPTVPNLRHVHVRAHQIVYMKSVDFHCAKHSFAMQGVKMEVTQDGLQDHEIDDTDDELGWDSDDDELWDSEEEDYMWNDAYSHHMLGALMQGATQLGNAADDMTQMLDNVTGMPADHHHPHP